MLCYSPEPAVLFKKSEDMKNCELEVVSSFFDAAFFAQGHLTQGEQSEAVEGSQVENQ